MMNIEDKYAIRKLLKNILCFLVLPFVVLVVGYLIYDHYSPLDVLVKIKDTRANPQVPFQSGHFTFSYGDTTITHTIRKGIFVEGIDYHYKKQSVILHFRSPGYCPLDTEVVLDKVITLYIKRDRRLAHLCGEVYDPAGNPIDSVRVRIKDNITFTDSAGQFALDIDSAKQQFEQNIYLSKQGYRAKVEHLPLLDAPAEEVRLHSILQRQTPAERHAELLKKKNNNLK